MFVIISMVAVKMTPSIVYEFCVCLMVSSPKSRLTNEIYDGASLLNRNRQLKNCRTYLRRLSKSKNSLSFTACTRNLFQIFGTNNQKQSHTINLSPIFYLKGDVFILQITISFPFHELFYLRLWNRFFPYSVHLKIVERKTMHIYISKKKNIVLWH